MGLLDGISDFFSDAATTASDAIGAAVPAVADLGSIGASELGDIFPTDIGPGDTPFGVASGGLMGQLEDLGVDVPDFGSISGSGAGSVGSRPPILFGAPSGIGVTQTMGAFPMIGRLTALVGGAILKLRARLGGTTTLATAGAIAGYGKRVWQGLSSWSAKNPGVSLVATLVSLGLTVEEAAHFIAWGSTQKRTRRARGITGRDLRTTRRTMRKLNRYVSALRHLCGPVHHRKGR
jgi:hypothetical protein